MKDPSYRMVLWLQDQMHVIGENRKMRYPKAFLPRLTYGLFETSEHFLASEMREAFLYFKGHMDRVPRIKSWAPYVSTKPGSIRTSCTRAPTSVRFSEIKLGLPSHWAAFSSVVLASQLDLADINICSSCGETDALIFGNWSTVSMRSLDLADIPDEPDRPTRFDTNRIMSP